MSNRLPGRDRRQVRPGRGDCLSSLILPLLAAGFLATLLITLAPGFGVDERELDNRFSAEGIANIRRSVAPQRNVLISYFSYLRGLAHGNKNYLEL